VNTVFADGLSLFAVRRMMEGVVPLPWPINLSNIVISHVAFCFPFVAVVVRSRLVGFNAMAIVTILCQKSRRR